ncbi:MAG: glutaredoxin [Gammaproteobacteria bacterium]|nr:glutaredoxin [Gammaproteobacteria bacterium]
MLMKSRTEASRGATLYRMVMEDHVCPYGLKAKDLLERHGFEVDDHWLETRAETDAFQEELEVRTTPQIFIGDERIGGYDELREHLSQSNRGAGLRPYRPVIAIFTVSLLMALAVSLGSASNLPGVRAAESFIAIAMCLLGVQKLQDVESFSTMFLNYDLLARRWVPYGYLYPYAETFAGVLMLAGALTWLSAPIAFFIGMIGAVSVFKAVYVDKRELKCACVGGNSEVPLGFISLTENVMMVLMAIWMASRELLLPGLG